MVLRGLDQRAQILGKTGAAEAWPGMEEFGADAVVETDAARDLLHVGVHLLAEVGDFVDEGDLGRKECVGGVLYEFSGAPGGVENGRLIEAQRP